MPAQCPSQNSDDPSDVLRCSRIQGGHTRHEQMNKKGKIISWIDSETPGVEVPKHPLDIRSD